MADDDNSIPTVDFPTAEDFNAAIAEALKGAAEAEAQGDVAIVPVWHKRAEILRQSRDLCHGARRDRPLEQEPALALNLI